MPEAGQFIRFAVAVFGTWKRSYRRMQSHGLAKAAVQVALIAIGYNLKSAFSIVATPV
ncbi:hypothetical protein [Mesorhizobium sp. WSM3868]|uniref:hypothetical protein n=1 Tax=Mesorhizobium sp. WSM3868 TaxID=2029405 RepID=UPI0015CCC902|nr:hypothetical protein [Mesorhizobium sp. WSM3868]